MPWEDASMATWVTPSSTSSAIVCCNLTGSGVVSEPYSFLVGVITPIVPIVAAAKPASFHIWRVNEATDVLPLVPVTATTVSGCLPKNRAATMASS